MAERKKIATDKEIAKFYEERRGDVSSWKPATTKPRSRQGSSTSVFSGRFSTDELDMLQHAAESRGQPISAFIREVALEAASPAKSTKF